MTTTEASREAALAIARQQFRDDLIEADLLVSMGIDGLYGRGANFERVVDGIEHVVQRKATSVLGDRPRVLRFPPLFSREQFERTDYIASFPNLTGAISTYKGDNAGHRALLADREAGRPWDGHLSPADTMLVSAACHPAYATLDQNVSGEGELIDVYGYCFRHEPAIDPARMQAFRMHEYLFVGDPEQAQTYRDTWIDHGLDVLGELGLSATPTAANDPFFGRLGKMLATNQVDEGLKTELVVRLYDDLDDGTAITSANCHRDHFGEKYDLSTPSGGLAHSSCVAFGIERIALAMLRTHGLNPDSWGTELRKTLGE